VAGDVIAEFEEFNKLLGSGDREGLMGRWMLDDRLRTGEDPAAAPAGEKRSPSQSAQRDHDELLIRGIVTAERKFDPAEPRDPHSGKWTDGPGGAVKDALKLAGKIALKDDEHLALSGQLNSKSGTGIDVVWAAVDSPRGREVRIGTVYEPEKWRAANKGSTAPLTTGQVAGLRDDLAAAEVAAKSAAKTSQAIYSRGGTPTDRVLTGEDPVAKGRIESAWGPVEWSVWLDDSDPVSYNAELLVGDTDLDRAQLPPDELRKFVKQLGDLVPAA
jgi:hypothetical protein